MSASHPTPSFIACTNTSETKQAGLQVSDAAASGILFAINVNRYCENGSGKTLRDNL
jgi:hypothetical protein